MPWLHFGAKQKNAALGVSFPGILFFTFTTEIPGINEKSYLLPYWPYGNLLQ